MYPPGRTAQLSACLLVPKPAVPGITQAVLLLDEVR